MFRFLCLLILVSLDSQPAWSTQSEFVGEYEHHAEEEWEIYYVNGKPKALKRTCAIKNGKASWYGGKFHGRRTANGEIFNQYELTAAHKTLPFNSLVRVSYKGRSVVVRINDAGPYAGGRVIDLSRRAAESLGMLRTGVAQVELKLVRCGK